VPRSSLDPALAPLGLTAARLRALRRAIPRLHRWYRAHARDLPWRRSRDPYAIWISEAMLQQTQVATVIPYYERWIAALPDVTTLAAAPEERVLKLWEGLGYYARARNLHRAAREVVRRHGGRLPSEPAAWRALPGVGPYTAAAVLSIALDHDLAVIDGNVRRVLSRLVALAADPRRRPHARALETLAEALLPRGTSARHNQAMMELGAVVCTPRAARCDACPLREVCAARAQGRPEAFPPRTRRRAVPHHEAAIALVYRASGELLIDRRPYDGLLGGLWEFPGGKLEPGESVEQALARELREELGLRVEVIGALPSVDHAYTHFTVTLHPRLCALRRMDRRVAEGRECRWVKPAELSRYPMPRANRKVIEALSQGAETVTQAARDLLE
jgi:A/G-specific adenine glycosylase